ncbi:MAG TPA: CYTH domain-containing protein [Gemmatimonadaceae bacterium]
MREMELKSVVDDAALRREIVERAGGKLEFVGTLIDHRYADPEGRMLAADNVLRLRIYESDRGREGHLDWKGPTGYEGGYKVREELTTMVGDPDSLAAILRNLGYSVIMRIERRIRQYSLVGATVRFEEYPLMDTLVEVEGSAESIERAIEIIGLPRSGFTTDRLTEFVARFEARGGERAMLEF